MGAGTGVQVSRKKFHTYTHLDYIKIKFLSCIKKNYEKKKKPKYICCLDRIIVNLPGCEFYTIYKNTYSQKKLKMSKQRFWKLVGVRKVQWGKN